MTSGPLPALHSGTCSVYSLVWAQQIVSEGEGGAGGSGPKWAHLHMTHIYAIHLGFTFRNRIQLYATRSDGRIYPSPNSVTRMD